MLLENPAFLLEGRWTCSHNLPDLGVGNLGSVWYTPYWVLVLSICICLLVWRQYAKFLPPELGLLVSLNYVGSQFPLGLSLY